MANSAATTRKLLFVRAGGGGRKQQYLSLKESLKTVELHVYDEADASERFPGVFTSCLTGPVDTESGADACVAKLEAAGLKPDGILTFDEFGVLLCAMVADRLGLPGLSGAAATTVRDKSLFREFCAQRDLPHPWFCNMTSASDIDAVPEDKFPVVFKPKQGAGSHFVRRCDSREQLRVAYSEAMQKLETSMDPAWEWARTGGAKEAFFVEGLLPGHEVDLDIVVSQGRVLSAGVSDNFPSRTPPFFLELGGCAPSHLDESIQLAVVDVVQRIVDELGGLGGARRPISCVMHFEALLTGLDSAKPSVTPIELNCRLGGAETWTRYLACWGEDLAVLAAQVALGMPPARRRSSLPPPQRHIISLNMVPDRSGILVAQDIPEAVRQHAAYFGSSLYWQQGSHIRIPPHGFQYLGWLLVVGDTHAAAMESLRDLVSQCTFAIQGPLEADPEDNPTILFKHDKAEDESRLSRRLLWIE